MAPLQPWGGDVVVRTSRVWTRCPHMPRLVVWVPARMQNGAELALPSMQTAGFGVQLPERPGLGPGESVWFLDGAPLSEVLICTPSAEDTLGVTI